MSEHVDKTIADFELKVKDAEQRLIEAKRMVNALYEHAGRPARYADADLQITSTAVSLGAMQGDEFHGKPLNTAIREYLRMRKSAQLGPATPEEIFQALIDGGFEFEGPADSALHGMKISLGKSSHTFKKLPNGRYGLAEWYGQSTIKRKRIRLDDSDATDNGEAEEESDEESEVTA